MTLASLGVNSSLLQVKVGDVMAEYQGTQGSLKWGIRCMNCVAGAEYLTKIWSEILDCSPFLSSWLL